MRDRTHDQIVALTVQLGQREAIFATDLVWICHELTPHARRDLLDGVATAVINQDAGHEVRSAIRVALAQLSGERLVAEQERIRIDIFVKDNLP